MEDMTELLTNKGQRRYYTDVLQPALEKVLHSFLVTEIVKYALDTNVV